MRNIIFILTITCLFACKKTAPQPDADPSAEFDTYIRGEWNVVEIKEVFLVESGHQVGQIVYYTPPVYIFTAGKIEVPTGFNTLNYTYQFSFENELKYMSITYNAGITDNYKIMEQSDNKIVLKAYWDVPMYPNEYNEKVKKRVSIVLERKIKR